MTVKIMLCPNPYRNKAIDRVIVLGRSEDGQFARVLNIDAIHKDPTILKPFGANYSRATTLWNFVALLIFVVGVGLSFYWKWWAFIPGAIICYVFLRANRTSTGDFAVEVLANNSDAYSYFVQKGLVWEAPVQSLVEA